MALVATTSPYVHQYSLEEFCSLDDPRGGGHYELIAGVLYMVPPPDGPHTTAVSRLNRRFASYLDAHPHLGELFFPRTAIWSSPNTYLEPDLMFVSAEHLKTMDPGHLTTADLVVEVLSPSTAMYDRTTKADPYAALKVGELWLIDPVTKTIEQRVLGPTGWNQPQVHGVGDTVQAARLVGFMCEVQAVFA